ncbi:MAG TPA: VOC family protein [Actinomycetota bacterium]|nr:VOC family protein [Actinomycetota bacterium]
MQKITPHLWFDTQAREAADFYTSLFEQSEVGQVTTLRDTPSGDADVVPFVLAGQRFMSINAGPLFKFNPSISFTILCASTDEVDRLWKELSEGGFAMMPLDSYPWSQRYGWVADRFGLSWQLMHVGDQPFTQKIVPSLMFVGDVCGKAEEAMGLYTSVFGGSVDDPIVRFGPDEQPGEEGTVKYASFTLSGAKFSAMDGGRVHDFGFNEAVSLMVSCDTQEEIDFFWDRLSAVPEAEQCGWLKDRYGVSWQVVPAAMDRMMQESDEATRARVTQAFLTMKKFDLAKLEEAYAGV